MLRTLRVFSPALVAGGSVFDTIQIPQQAIGFLRLLAAGIPLNASLFCTISDSKKTLEFQSAGMTTFPMIEDIADHDGLLASPVGFRELVTFTLTNPVGAAPVNNVQASILLDITPRSFRNL